MNKWQRWYRKNPENARQYYREKAARRRKELKRWFQELKETLECSMCGESHPSCIEFHHVDPAEKLDHVSELVNKGHSKLRILQEIEKCEILCANCHRKVHS